MSTHDTSTLRVLSISFYGSGLGSSGAHYSGAFARQEDYAALLRAYDVLVPGTAAGEHATGRLRIITVPSRGALGFMYGAYQHAVTLHRQAPYDVVMIDNPHLGAMLGYALRLRLRIPLIIHAMADTLHNPWYVRERFSNRIKHFLMRCAFRIADAYRVSTTYEVERLTHAGYNVAKVVVVPFYIEQEEWKHRMGETNASREHNRLLYVGRLGPQKDVSTLLTAFGESVAAGNTATLVLLGQGGDTPILKKKAAMLRILDRVVFLGAVPYEQIASEYARASHFVISSLYEGTCMVLQEATLASLPIIATDTAGAHDLLSPQDEEGEAGWLVPIHDLKAFAKALINAVANPDEAVARNERAQHRLQKLTKEEALLAFTRLIVTALHSPGS